MEQKIKASDLRIGNLVIYSNGSIVFKVIGISEFGIDIENEVEKTYIEYDEFEPIQLTEEWLLKFGFNCVNNTKMVFKLYHNDKNADFSSLILKEVGNNPIWVYSVNNRWTINPFPIDLKYVHQLQNIYFALTGEELIMKQ